MERGEVGFHNYYRSIYPERWDDIVRALHLPPSYMELRDGLLQPYYLDAASVAAASLLPLDDAREVVDLCAAPGGKSLVLALRLWRTGQDGDVRLVANELSPSRRNRLIRVLDTHLPPEMRSRVSVYGHDAARWGVHRPESADAVLADVPCSSEGHLLGNAKELSRWGKGRIKRNVTTQHAILAAAADSVRPGGHILYATCALTPEENDDVVEWVLRRRPGKLTPLTADDLRGLPAAADHPLLLTAETTRRGLHILPDTSGGAGPIYLSLLRRDD